METNATTINAFRLFEIAPWSTFMNSALLKTFYFSSASVTNYIASQAGLQLRNTNITRNQDVKGNSSFPYILSMPISGSYIFQYY